MMLSRVADVVLQVFPFFFFSCRRPHRDLHSFPTRRSSDLALRDGRGLARRPGSGREDRDHRSHVHDLRHAAAADAGGAERSEEHTSELQSRRDLVCRLLLEKKKKKPKTAKYSDKLDKTLNI